MSIIFQQLVRNSNGVLNVTLEPPTSASQGLLLGENNLVYAEVDGVIAQYSYGLPFSASGALVVSSDPIDHYDQSLGFTASGALCIAEDDGVTHYAQGIAFGANGGVSVSGAVTPSGPSNAFIASSTAPYLIAYDTSEVPWQSNTDFLDVMPDSACLAVVANTTHIAYSQDTAPFLRLFLRDGTAVPLTGITLTFAPKALVFDDTNNRLWFIGNGGKTAEAFNYLTGVPYFLPSSADVEDGTGIALSGGGDRVVFAGNDGAVSVRVINTSGSGGSINGPPSGDIGLFSSDGAVTNESYLIPSTSPTARAGVYGESLSRLFDYGDVATTVTSLVNYSFCNYSTGGKIAVFFGDNACNIYTITGPLANRYNRITDLPPTWPAGGVAGAAFSPDDTKILLSNGQIFNISVTPFIEIAPPSLLPSNGTYCEYVSTI